MTSSNRIRCQVVLWSVLLIGVGSAYANPIAEESSFFHGDNYLLTILVVAVIGLYIEWLVIKLLSKLFLVEEITPRQFLTVNALTWPTTQLAALSLGVIAELIPLLGEPFLYKNVVKYD